MKVQRKTMSFKQFIKKTKNQITVNKRITLNCQQQTKFCTHGGGFILVHKKTGKANEETKTNESMEILYCYIQPICSVMFLLICQNLY